MDIVHESVVLKDSSLVKEKLSGSNVWVFQQKVQLSSIKGLETTIIEKDCISTEVDKIPKAVMPCGHVIGSESMLSLLKSEKDYKIVCPDYTKKGDRCNTEWPFNLCKTVANLGRSELNKLEDILFMKYADITLHSRSCPQCLLIIIREDAHTKKTICP